MLKVCHQPVARVSDDELRKFVRSALAGRRKDASHLRTVNRSLYDYHSSFAIELLVAEFEDGSQLPLIFKDLSPHALLEEARRVRPRHLYRPEREIVAYREILAAADLEPPTPNAILADPTPKRTGRLLGKAVGAES